MKKLVMFSATWCGPCKIIKPAINRLIKEGLNIEVVDLDKDEKRALDEGISSVPTFILYEGDVEIGRVSGLPTESDVKGWME